MISSYKKKISIYSFFLFFSTFLFGQQNAINTNTLASFNHAIELYNNKGYTAAQKYFEKIASKVNIPKNLQADADYYNALCAIKLNQTDADEKVNEFVIKYPDNTKKDKMYFIVGNYYFANKNPAYALKWYSKVTTNFLSLENKKELNFKMGYALLVTKNLTLAKKRFLPLINDPKYGNYSRYYYGYIAYKQEDYEEAEATFSEIADVDSFKSEITYYLLDISFKMGNFERCIEIGEKLLKKTKRRNQSEIVKIIGESYFNLKKYKEAIPYLKAYKGKRGKWNNTDYYMLGYAFYKQNDFKNAITYFNKIIDAKDAVAQNAYYHLAQCYLKLDQKPAALNAFKSASEMGFDKQIKEDAALNYAKLSYEEGNPYKSVALVLQDFLKAYPKSKHYNEINQLIVTSFIHQQDYKGALAYLSKNKTAENKEFVHEVSLYRGMQLFNQNKFKEALLFLVQATQSNQPKIKAKALFWNAETQFQLHNFKKAIEVFLRFEKHPLANKVAEYQQLYYNIGYAFFKQKDYHKSAVYFKKFVQQNSEDVALNDDATLRLGDAYYATKNYTKAILFYQKIIKELGTGADYAQYQIGMSYGFLGKHQEKITALKAVVNDFQSSSLKDDALFQLGNTFAIIKQNTDAHLAYQQLLKKHPKSSYIPTVLLRDGLLYYNDNESEKALERYKEIVAKFPKTNESHQAIANARNVYVDLGTVDEYATWIQTIPFANISNEELDNTTYEAAENKFLDDKIDKAISGFTKYTQKFPNGLHALSANFYLAQLLYQKGEKTKATRYYEFVVSENRSDFSEAALNNLSQIYLEEEKWSDAIPLLERLEQEANLPQNILFAQSNLMKGYYQEKNYKKAVIYAEKVLQNDKVDEQVEYDAKIIIARAAFINGDEQTAEDFYTEIERNATGELKAESLYYKAYFLHKNKNYKEANAVIQKLASEFAAYKSWGLKGLILMAKNFYALKDAYQATYILENVIKNAGEFEDIVQDAKNELKKIKINEAKTNNSVTPQNK